jgi:hypothetical protein
VSRGAALMETISTAAGDYTVYLGSEARRNREQHDADKWYFEPESYVGYTVFSGPYASVDDAKQAALETGAREERLKNEIGGL